MPDPIETLSASLGPGPVIVQLRQDVKRGGELMATYEMEYPSLRDAMAAISDDLRAGRVERLSAGGVAIWRDDLAALASAAGADEA